MSEQWFIRDPVHGVIQTNEMEWRLIQSRPLQRLKGIKQLGLVDAVYPGANHSRFEHSVGTMHVAGLIAGLRAGLPLADIARLATAFSLCAITRLERKLPDETVLADWQAQIVVERV